jgi:hypothetical protein
MCRRPGIIEEGEKGKEEEGGRRRESGWVGKEGRMGEGQHYS